MAGTIKGFWFFLCSFRERFCVLFLSVLIDVLRLMKGLGPDHESSGPRFIVQS